MISRAKSVYLDYAASAPIRPEVEKALARVRRRAFGNPSSVHSAGQQALNEIDGARREIAEVLNCQPEELIFTSGGTEADNLAIKGVVKKSTRGHVVTTAIEHKAVLESCARLEALGYDVTYIRPNETGIVPTEKIVGAIRDNTVLVSVMYVNNETGMIQPISEIGEAIYHLNQTRGHKVLFHTDAVQGASLLPINVEELKVDLLTISAHKLGGPKGSGCLYVRSGIELAPEIDGGGQQRGARSGTLNVEGIVGLAAALTTARKKQEAEKKRLTELQNRLVEKLKRLPGVVLNGDIHYRIPSILNISVSGFTSDQLVIGCDLGGVCVSAASACASGSIQPSYVLAAMGYNDEQGNSSLRISIGHQTRPRDVDRLMTVLAQIIRP